MKPRLARYALPLAAFLMLSAGVAFGEDLLTFGTAKGRLDKIDGTAGSQVKITFGEDFLKAIAPNFWSARWQFNNIGLDLTERKPTDSLEIEVAGDTGPDEGPILKVLLFSADWKKMSLYTFDLSGLKKDEFTKIKATGTLANPVEKNEGGVDIGTPVGNVMMMTSSKSGNAPWVLKIKSLAVVNDAGK